MPNSKIVTETHFADGLVELVEENIEFNNETMLENIYEAAKASKHKLATRKGSWIGRNKVGHDRMFHRKGWKIYRENWYGQRNVSKTPARRTAVIASKIEPSLTHLIEFGHVIVMPWLDDPWTGASPILKRADQYTGESSAARTQAFYYIAEAYLVGKSKLMGDKVDNP